MHRCVGGVWCCCRFIAQAMTFDNRLGYRSQNDRRMRVGMLKRSGISVNGEKEMTNIQGNLLRSECRCFTEVVRLVMLPIRANERYRDVLRTIYGYNASEDASAADANETTHVPTFSNSTSDVQSAAVSAEALDDARNPAYSPAPLPRRTRKRLSMPSGRLREVCTSPYKTLDAPHLEVRSISCFL